VIETFAHVAIGCDPNGGMKDTDDTKSGDVQHPTETDDDASKKLISSANLAPSPRRAQIA
jgi:hypothetical protein